MSDVAYDHVLSQFLQLSPADQARLLAEYGTLAGSSADPLLRRSILELEGLGKEVWNGIDAQRYVDEERASWNG